MHGYHVTFFWGGMLLILALLVSTFFINARKEDVPSGAHGRLTPAQG